MNKIKELVEFRKVTRVEVIGKRREFVTYDAKNVKVSLQDNGKTLKIFIN